MVDPWSPDRRRGERREVPFPLYAHLTDEADGPAAPARQVRVSGLSVGGMVIESSAVIPAGRRVSLTIDTTDGSIGPLVGRVVHSRLVLIGQPEAAPSYIAGLAFDPRPPSMAASLETLLGSFEQHPAPRGARQVP